MLSFIIIFVGIDVLFIAFAFIKGRSLPVSHTVSLSRVFKTSPEMLWNIVVDRQHLPAWRRKLNSVEVIDASNWKEISGGSRMQYRVVVAEPFKKLKTKIMNTDLPYGGGWEFEFKPDIEGAELTITEQGEVYNPFFRFISKYIIGHDNSIKSYMTDLKKKVSKS